MGFTGNSHGQTQGVNCTPFTASQHVCLLETVLARKKLCPDITPRAGHPQQLRRMTTAQQPPWWSSCQIVGTCVLVLGLLVDVVDNFALPRRPEPPRPTLRVLQVGHLHDLRNVYSGKRRRKEEEEKEVEEEEEEEGVWVK